MTRDRCSIDPEILHSLYSSYNDYWCFGDAWDHNIFRHLNSLWHLMSYGSIGSASGLLSDDRWCCLAITEASVDMSSTGPHRIKFNKDWYEMLQNFNDGQSTLVALLNHRPCCAQEISIQGNIKLLCIFYHSSKLRWCKYLKSFLMKDKGPPALHNKYYACTRQMLW